MDKEALDFFVERARDRWGIRPLDAVSVLDNLGMIRDGRLTIAGLLCFPKIAETLYYLG